jgi:uncharacterized protein YprB with RNaseH-like and TPR domain
LRLSLKALSPKEYKDRRDFRCVHRHNGLPLESEHPRCYDQAKGLTEKLAFFDIECTGLKSDFGIILCYSLRGEMGDNVANTITPEEMRSGVFDKRLLKQLCQDLKKYDRIITWNGRKFDVPFVLSRCILHKIKDFPLYKEIYHTDALEIARYRLATLHSKRLGIVAGFYGIKAKEHPLEPTIWLRCLSGDVDSLKFVQTHCNEDTQTLLEVWKKVIEPYAKLNKTSI